MENNKKLKNFIVSNVFIPGLYSEKGAPVADKHFFENPLIAKKSGLKIIKPQEFRHESKKF